MKDDRAGEGTAELRRALGALARPGAFLLVFRAERAAAVYAREGARVALIRRVPSAVVGALLRARAVARTRRGRKATEFRITRAGARMLDGGTDG